MVINLLVTLLILCLVFGLLLWCIRLLPLPAPFGLLVQVLLVFVFVLVLLGMVWGGGVSVPMLRVR